MFQTLVLLTIPLSTFAYGTFKFRFKRNVKITRGTGRIKINLLKRLYPSYMPKYMYIKILLKTRKWIHLNNDTMIISVNQIS